MKASLRTPASPALAKARECAEREARRQFVTSRQSRGWSQVRAATELGVNACTLADWERGAAKVPGWALIAIRAGVAA